MLKCHPPPTTNARGTRITLIESHHTMGNTKNADYRNLETCPSGFVGKATQINRGLSRGTENGTRNLSIFSTVQTVDTQNSDQPRVTTETPIFSYSGSSDSGFDTGGPASAPRNKQKHVSGIKPVNAPFFGSLNTHVLKEAKRTIIGYENRVKNHNIIHGLENKLLQVLFMLRKGLGRALIEELLMPDEKYDPTDDRQLACVRDYFFRKTGTPGISGHIEIEAFEKGMRDLRMDVRDTSWASRTTTFLSKITPLLEDTRVQLEPKKLIRKCMRGVMPHSLKQRLHTLMESGTDDERAASKDMKV